MAVRKKGTDVGFRGKIRNEVVYELNGQIVKRSIGINTKPPTIAVQTVWQGISIVSAFLDSLKEFVEMGFEIEARNERKNYHNIASSYLRKNALTGTYPDVQLDCSKVLVSKGLMPLTQDVKVELSSEGLEVSWNPDSRMVGHQPTDHVMMLAYFPELENAIYTISGANRKQGHDQLQLPLFRTEQVIEVYVSFVAANHKSIMNSIYIGKFTWNPLG